MNIKIKYVDFWKGFKPKDEPLFYQHINKLYNIQVVDSNPDILIVSAYGNQHLKESAPIKVFYTAECHKFNNNFFDYSFSFEAQSDKNFYLPNYIRKYGFNHYHELSIPLNLDITKKTEFCCFVHDNCEPKMRNAFMKKLSERKFVESSGKCHNNVGFKAPKGQAYFDYINKFKFMITFENQQVPKYNTEKIYNSLYANTLPIYWGDPFIKKSFNEDTFINVDDFKNLDEVIDYVMEIDANDELYKSFFNKNKLNEIITEESFDIFFKKIIESIK